MANRDTAKQWFQTGDKPTQAQFHQLLDYLRFKDEEITVADIQDLLDVLGAKADTSALEGFEQGQRVMADADFSYDIPEGCMLEKIIVLPGSDTNFKIGSDYAGDDICPEVLVTEDAGLPIVLHIYAKVARVIYLGGIPTGSAVVFFKRLVKQL
jgi:hypothetical protein